MFSNYTTDAVDSVDIEIGWFVIHSVNELILEGDLEYMYKAMCSFYNTPRKKGMVKIFSNNQDKR